MATLLKAYSFSGHQPWEKSKAILILSIVYLFTYMYINTLAS